MNMEAQKGSRLGRGPSAVCQFSTSVTKIVGKMIVKTTKFLPKPKSLLCQAQERVGHG